MGDPSTPPTPSPCKRPRLKDYAATPDPLRYLTDVRSKSTVDAPVLSSDVKYMDDLGLSDKCSRCGVWPLEIGGSRFGFSGISCGRHGYCARCYFNSNLDTDPDSDRFLYGNRKLESDAVRALPLVATDKDVAKRWSSESDPVCFGCALRSPYSRPLVVGPVVLLGSDSD